MSIRERGREWPNGQFSRSLCKCLPVPNRTQCLQSHTWANGTVNVACVTPTAAGPPPFPRPLHHRPSKLARVRDSVYVHEFQAGLPRTAGKRSVVVVGRTLFADGAQHVLLVRMGKRRHETEYSRLQGLSGLPARHKLRIVFHH